MRTPSLSRCLTIAATLATIATITATPAQAQLKTWAETLGGTRATINDNHVWEQSSTGSTTPTVSTSSTAVRTWSSSQLSGQAYAYADAAGWGSAQAGVLRARASATFGAVLPPTHASALVEGFARTNVGFTDYATFGLAGYASGTSVTVTGRMQLTGLLDHAGMPQGQYDIITRFFGRIGNSTFRREFYDYVNGPVWESVRPIGFYPSGYADGAFFVSATIVLGARTELGMGLAAEVAGDQLLTCAGCSSIQSVDGAVNSDFSNTLRWDGFSAVRVGDTDIDPTLLRVSSESGFDYSTRRTAVPEPATAPLIGLGLALLAAMRTSRRRTASL